MTEEQPKEEEKKATKPKQVGAKIRTKIIRRACCR